jgi:glycosyltransferase involved in cell wall biosynthesis
MENQIRILDIITTAQGGKRLLENRVSVVNKDREFMNFLACPEDPFFTREFQAKGVHFLPFPMSRTLQPLYILRELFYFSKIIKKYNFDIVHAHTSKAGAVARIGCSAYNFFHFKKKIYVAHQVHSFYFNSLGGLKKLFFIQLEKILSRLTDSLLFQNNHELEQGITYRMDKRAILINIGNGINLQEFEHPRITRSLPEWLQLNFGGDQAGEAKPFVIICVARVEPKKNHSMLVDTLVLLRKKITAVYGENAGERAFKAFCVGEIGNPAIIQYASEQGLGRQIEFTGIKDRNEVASLLEKSHLSVLTSTAEGKPRALMESMNMGIPCIATDVCGTRDVIDSGKTGFLAPLNNAETFADLIFLLMQDRDLYQTFSENSIKKAVREFDENRVIEKLKQIYREKPRKTRRKTHGKFLTQGA